MARFIEDIYFIIEEMSLPIFEAKYLVKMIEQTELVITDWIFLPSSKPIQLDSIVKSETGLDVMQKRAQTKKGLAVRLTSRIQIDNTPVLMYVAEHSYVIDFEDVIDKTELVRMFRNSFKQFNEKYEIRKLGTVLVNCYLSPLDESKIDYDKILPLLVIGS